MIKKVKKIIHEFNALREYRRYAQILNEASKDLSHDNLVDFILSEKWRRFFWIIQIPSEIKSFLNKVASVKPKVIVEIGTKMGGTLFLFTKVAARGGQII